MYVLSVHVMVYIACVVCDLCALVSVCVCIARNTYRRIWKVVEILFENSVFSFEGLPCEGDEGGREGGRKG